MVVTGAVVLGGVGVLIGALLLAVLACDAVFLPVVFTGGEDLALVMGWVLVLLGLVAGAGFTFGATFLTATGFAADLDLTATLGFVLLAVMGVFLAGAGVARLTAVFTDGLAAGSF